jgi:hypothetical protein
MEPIPATRTIGTVQWMNEIEERLAAIEKVLKQADPAEKKK